MDPRDEGDELQRLRAWLAAHPDPAEPIATAGGGEVTAGDDGKKSMVMPYAIYGRTIDTFWAALNGVPGWTYKETGGYLDVTHRWLRAARKRTVTPDDFTRMGRNDVLHFLRWIDRGEKFCTGHWVGCFKEGLMHAAARALIAHGPVPARPAPIIASEAQGELL